MKILSHPTKFFQDRIVPEESRLAGWAALVETLGVRTPVREPTCVSVHHVRGSRRRDEDWLVLDKRYWPGDELEDHLAFALRHENLDLLILHRLLAALPQIEVESIIRATPVGSFSRRLWYFYEFLTGRRLDLPDCPNTAAVDLLDPKTYVTGKPRISKRHRVRDNLLGTAQFCPVIRRTRALTEFLALDLAAKARQTVGRTGAHLISRAASFLLLADSRASFEIEGERPPRNRLERWGRAVLDGGKNPLTLDEILRLQRILIEDNRFVQAGLRADGVCSWANGIISEIHCRNLSAPVPRISTI